MNEIEAKAQATKQKATGVVEVEDKAQNALVEEKALSKLRPPWSRPVGRSDLSKLRSPWPRRKLSKLRPR